MEEQNILAGDSQVLDKIIRDVKEYNQNCSRFDGLSGKARELSRNIDAAEQQVKDTIESKIKESTGAICSGYDKTIAKEKDKIRDVLGKRDKAKLAGVRERIANETASLRSDNDGLYAQIKEAFDLEKIPMFASSRFFLAMFYTKGIADVLFFLFALLIIYAVLSAVLYFIPGVPVWVYMVSYFVLTAILFLVYKLVSFKIIFKHLETIEGACNTKVEIKANKKKMKRIIKHIKHDKNEDMYGLHSYDEKVNELHDNISKVEEEKARALQEFEQTVKQDIIAEIDGRDRDQINAMIAQLKKMKQELSFLESTINDETIRISSKYETYLGKDGVRPEVLSELMAIMKSGAADTIGQALSVRDKKH